MENSAGYVLRQSHLQVLKMNVTWYPILASFHARNTIQSKEHSMDGAKDGIGYNPSWTNPNGNANFPYVNSNGNSNFNWTDNDFNDNWRWLVRVSNSRSFPASPCGGVFFFYRLLSSDCSPFIHPPSIFPISFKCSESVIYFLLSSALSSHEICRKNLSESSLMLALRRYGSFCSFWR